MALARADLESLLRTRQLDRTLTTALPPLDPGTNPRLAPSGIPALDARLGGGFPRGQLSELVGPRSSGRTSLLLQMLAAATARGELVALVDALDMFDVESAAAAGVDLARLLWIRGHVVIEPGPVPRYQSARARAGDPRAHAGPAGRQFRPRRLRRRRSAGRSHAPAAVHDLAAAAAHGRREPDDVRAGGRRADGAELGGADAAPVRD